MKRINIVIYSVFALILAINLFYYLGLYRRQINYISALLNRQVQIVGYSVDNTNNHFISDLNRISFLDDLTMFFIDEEKQSRAKENMKLFFSKYEDFITGMKLYDNNKHEFTLKKDENGEWLDQPSFTLQAQGEIFEMDVLVHHNKRYEYYLPVIKNNVAIGNIVVILDYQKYFAQLFSVFNMKDYQWQWVLSDSGKIIYNNFGGKIKYTRIDKLTSDIIDGAISNLIHKAEIDGKSREIVSSYYSTQLLQKDFGIIFSAPTGFFQKYIIRNSLYIVLGTLLLIQLIFFVFRKYFKAQQEEIRKRAESEKMLFRIIDEMPAGVIIYNKNREILMANKVAAVQYSYPGEEEMKGKIFPETSLPEISEYFSKNLGGAFNPEQFVIIHKDSSDIILSRNSIPIVYLGEEATMEILVDVTMLESERKQEARANVAKSEFLARMSYEIRTPLNGIIGMTDILHKKDISMEARELVSLLRRSAEELINIINDILDFSKIETGKMILDEVPFDVRDEITYCGDLARTFITEKGVILSYEIDENIPGSIISDPFRLRQILTNLISYSSSNTSEGEIRLGCKLVSNKKGHVTLGFEIADTGLRLDKASLNNDFGEMVSIESKTRREGDESVFGTILSKQLIEIMGGSLTAVSPSGLSGDKGTKIYFMINAYSNEKPSKNLNLEMIRSVGSIKTLVITGSQYRDEETLGILHKTGLNITVTTFHKSTIGQIKTNLSRPDDRYNLVVILDHPGFNGFDVAGAIWENNLSDKLILLMISSNDKKGNYLKCITNGIDHYLVRPFDNSDITRVLQESFPNVDHSLQVDMTNIRKDIGILIVEDNKMNQKIITAMLKNMGYSSDIAEDGYDGLVKAKTKKYDLIFMDLFMPEMNGYEAAQRILEVDKSVLIVAFTADNLPETKKKAELSGIKEFIIKPVRTTDIIRLLTKYFQVN